MTCLSFFPNPNQAGHPKADGLVRTHTQIHTTNIPMFTLSSSNSQSTVAGGWVRREGEGWSAGRRLLSMALGRADGLLIACAIICCSHTLLFTLSFLLASHLPLLTAPVLACARTPTLVPPACRSLFASSPLLGSQLESQRSLLLAMTSPLLA